MNVEQHEFTEEILLRFTREGLKGAHRVIRNEVVGDGEILGIKDRVEPVDLDELAHLVGEESARLVTQAAALIAERNELKRELDVMAQNLEQARANTDAVGRIAATRDREIAALRTAAAPGA